MPNCHCGANASYEQCCEPVIKGSRSASTAEQLMRARYSAYAASEIDFLHDSLHPDGRSEFDFDATRKWAESSEWQNLKILACKAGGENDKVGSVEFSAVYVDREGKTHKHNERSHFKRVDDAWYFCDGQQIAVDKVGRNDPCTCGSGKKYKKCCGA
ncbi:MAG: YchJ family protein [Gammaproteobacteria bacterium]|nr:YchJ family protein [Gammaproteobacteria bacterium]NNM12083.1 YchJ family protein [Pseudomonadales bacterium]